MNFNFNALFPNDNGTVVEFNTNTYAEKICNLFDYWINDNENKITISPFMQIIEAFVGKKYRVPACHWSKDCSKSFSAIDIYGNLYPCEHWVGNKSFCFGNIKNGFVHEISKCDYFSSRHDILKNNECMDCEIWELCYGGCPWNAFSITGLLDRKDSTICNARRQIIGHIKETLIKFGKIKQKTENV